MTLRSRLAPACLPACVSLLILAAPSLAQAQMPRTTVMEQVAGSRQEGWVSVQNSINYFVAGPTGEGEEAQKLRDRARRTIYEIAARECDILREVIAKECRLVSVSSNMSRQYGQQQPEGFTINGSMNLQITLK